ncbi:MAG: hypothetical protein IPH48_10830 [bacterium]|nr:hypothetical protein [bacterium]
MVNSKIQILPSTETSLRQGVDVREILEIVIRRKWVILAIAAPIILLSIVGTLRSADVVTASARVLIEGDQPDQLTNRIGRMDYDEVMATAAQIGMSIPVAELAAAALVDSMPGLAMSDPNFAGAVSAQDLRDALLGGVDCGQVGESRILRISFTDANPRFSIMAVEALMEAFMEYSVESVRNHRAIGYFEEQIAIVQAEIDDLMRQRASVLNESGYSTFKISAQAESNYSGVVDLDYQRAKSRRLGPSGEA